MRPLLYIAALALMGCPIGNDKFPKPADLTPGWQVDKPRLLAVRAEPPEIRTGESATFEALLAQPGGGESDRVILWLACPPEDEGGIGFGCDLSNPDAVEFLAIDPPLTPRYTAPDDLLDGLDEQTALEGIYVIIQSAILPPDALEGGFEDLANGGFPDDLDLTDLTAAYKRLVVSSKDIPNQNPAIAAWRLEDTAIGPETTVIVDPGQEYEFSIDLAEGTVEFYDYVNAEGEVEERVEEPYASWYADGGTILAPNALYPYLKTTWRSPSKEEGPTAGSLWVVLRDRRGGFGWSQLKWQLR